MSTAICYAPDGSQFTDPAFQPCDQFDNVVSMCCGTNHTDPYPKEVCLPNGLCLGKDFVNNVYVGPAYFREACTDRTWQNPNCLRNVCTDPSQGGTVHGNSPMTLCNDGTWCCGLNNQTCCRSQLGISVAPTLQAAETATATAIITTTSILTPTSASTTISTTTASATPSDSLSHTGIALVTIGAVFLIAAIIAFLFLYRKTRQRHNAISQRQPVDVDESWRKSEMPLDRGNLPPHELAEYRAEPVELQNDSTV